MATHALDPAYRRITAEEFLRMDFGDAKAELVEGVIHMMADGSRRHSAIQGNLIVSFMNKLQGSGCRPYTSDLAVKTAADAIRYPDVSVYCRQNEDPENDNDLLIGDPKVIVEILSPSTARLDQMEKLPEYQALSGVDTILFVDPDTQTVRIVQRTGEESWNDERYREPHNVTLPALDITLTHEEIFAR